MILKAMKNDGTRNLVINKVSIVDVNIKDRALVVICEDGERLEYDAEAGIKLFILNDDGKTIDRMEIDFSLEQKAEFARQEREFHKAMEQMQEAAE